MPLCSRKFVFTNVPVTLLVKESGPPSRRYLHPYSDDAPRSPFGGGRENSLPDLCNQLIVTSATRNLFISELPGFHPSADATSAQFTHTQAHVLTLPVHVDVGSPLPAPQPRTMRRFGPNASAVIFRLFPLHAEADLVRYESRVCLLGFDEPNRRNH